MTQIPLKSGAFFLAVVSMAVLVAGCNKEPTVSEQMERAQSETEQAAKNIQNYTYAQKSEFVQHLQAQLDTLNQDLARLSAKIENSSDAVKAEATPKLQDLREKAGQLKDKLADLKNANASTWDSVKASAQNALDSLKARFQEARQWASDKMAPH